MDHAGDKDLQSKVQSVMATLLALHGPGDGGRLQRAWAAGRGGGVSSLEWAVAAEPCVSVSEAIGGGFCPELGSIQTALQALR